MEQCFSSSAKGPAKTQAPGIGWWWWWRRRQGEQEKAEVHTAGCLIRVQPCSFPHMFPARFVACSSKMTRMWLCSNPLPQPRFHDDRKRWRRRKQECSKSSCLGQQQEERAGERGDSLGPWCACPSGGDSGTDSTEGQRPWCALDLFTRMNRFDL